MGPDKGHLDLSILDLDLDLMFVRRRSRRNDKVENTSE